MKLDGRCLSDMDTKTKIFKEIFVDGKKELAIATSYSQIDSYLGCPYRWYRDYLLGERESVKAEALALGTSVHETLEQYFNGVAQGKKFTVAQAQDMLAFNMELNEIPYTSEENKVEAEQQHNDMVEGLVVGTSELAKFMKDKEVVATEKEFQLCINLPFEILFNGTKYNKVYIVGSIDFIVKDKKGGLHVVDFKSGKKVFEAKKLKENLQLPIYSLVVLQIYGRLPASTQYYFTRLDEFQEVLPIVENELDRITIYYKNGKIKQQGRLVQEVIEELWGIFADQYTTGVFEPKPCALCSWCSHGLYDKNNCEHAMFYKRKDIPLPRKNIKRFRKN